MLICNPVLLWLLLYERSSRTGLGESQGLPRQGTARVRSSQHQTTFIRVVYLDEFAIYSVDSDGWSVHKIRNIVDQNSEIAWLGSFGTMQDLTKRQH